MFLIMKIGSEPLSIRWIPWISDALLGSRCALTTDAILDRAVLTRLQFYIKFQKFSFLHQEWKEITLIFRIVQMNDLSHNVVADVTSSRIQITL